MTIDEAIKHIDDCMSETEKILYPEVWAAHQLGIEALKRYKTWREIDTYPGFEILPGETKQQ